MVKLRPLLKNLLEYIHSLFRETKDSYLIYIYTAGTKEYAEEIIKYINYSFDYNYLSNDRLVAREDILSEKGIVKSIKKVLPSDENMVIIIDDRIDVWGSVENLININAFYFFREDKNKNKYPLEKFLKKDDDLSLFSIIKLLNFIHKSFYEYYKRFNTICDVKIIKKEKLKKIFNNLFASFVEDPSINILETYEFHIINSFGGEFDDIISRKTNAIITNFIGENGIHFFKK